MDDGARTPLLGPRGRALLARLSEHPDAPRWTYAVGDRLAQADVEAVDRFRVALRARGSPSIPPVVEAMVARALETVPRLRGIDARLEDGWARLPTSDRGALAAEPWTFVPDDVDLDRMLVYRTAGTTGHPVSVPHHPVAIANYLPLVEAALALHGIAIEPHPDEVACVLVSAQLRTYTYATVLSAWGGAGFAKVNLRPTDWPSAGAAQRWLGAVSPQLVNGEPVAFGELLALAPDVRPRAMLSTSQALSPAVTRAARDAFGAVVLDWYSLVETGPIAVSCREGLGLHVLPADVYVEVVDEAGQPLSEGSRGEVVVSGGRNPFLPLVRYRTGDHASLRLGCPCGDRAPALVGLVGRSPVVFRASDGTPVGPVDVARRLRELPLLLHRLHQSSERRLVLTCRALPDHVVDPRDVAVALGELFGDLPSEVVFDPDLGRHDVKVVPYRSDVS